MDKNSKKENGQMVIGYFVKKALIKRIF